MYCEWNITYDLYLNTTKCIAILLLFRLYFNKNIHFKSIRMLAYNDWTKYIMAIHLSQKQWTVFFLLLSCSILFWNHCTAVSNHICTAQCIITNQTPFKNSDITFYCTLIEYISIQLLFLFIKHCSLSFKSFIQNWTKIFVERLWVCVECWGIGENKVIWFRIWIGNTHFNATMLWTFWSRICLFDCYIEKLMAKFYFVEII